MSRLKREYYGPASVRVFREMELRGSVSIVKEIYFKELAHTTMWAAKSDTGRAGQQAGEPQES